MVGLAAVQHLVFGDAHDDHSGTYDGSTHETDPVEAGVMEYQLVVEQSFRYLPDGRGGVGGNY